MFERLFQFVFRFEKVIFFLVVLLFGLYFFSYRFYVTGDGPAHLYNANLIVELIGGADQPITTYFELNSFPVPNWTGHLILAFLNLFLPTEAVEKVFLILYFFGFAYSFKYLLQSFKSDSGLFSLLILPFGFSLFLHSGFYNFCIAFIFLFLVMGFFIRNVNRINFKSGSLLMLLLILLYFSHITITVFAVFFLFLFLSWNIFLMKEMNLGDKIKRVFKRSVGLILICLPVLVLTFFYALQHVAGGKLEFLETSELLVRLTNMSPLVGHGSGEHLYTRIYLFVAVFLILFALVKRYWKSEIRFEFKKEDALFISAIFLLIFYFVLPDGDGKGGYISDRILYLFYILVFVRLMLLDFPKWIINDAVILVLITFYFHLQLKQEGQAAMSKWAKFLVEAGEKIEPNSVVLPINCSSHWQAVHLPKYLGAKKPIILLENYEAGHIYFPIQWKNNLPIHTTNNTRPKPVCNDYFQHFGEMKVLPDYLLFYGWMEIQMPDECAKSDSASYLKPYTSIHKNDFCELYELR